MPTNRSNQSSGSGIVATAFLACSLAVFGCSTNRTPGDGQPSMTPNASPAATPGTSSGTSNPPMASASEIGMNVERANEAAAVMAAHQPRYFGVIGAEGVQRTPPEAMHTGQFIPPSLTANPESTINGSISSDANAYITNGLDANAFVPPPGTVVDTSTTSPATTASTFPTPNVAASGTTLTPTQSSSAIPSPNSAANAPLRTQQSTTAASSTTAGRVAPVRLISNATGVVTLTNSAATNSANSAATAPAATAPMVIKGK